MADIKKDSFRWSWRECFYPFHELWQRDKLFVFIFIAVNLFAGQIGVVTSLSFAFSTPDVEFKKVWLSNTDAAAFYTFSITLLTGALAALAAEVIDKIRAGEQVDRFEYKAFWSVLAGVLIVLQSPLAGNLIARASLNPPVASGPSMAAATMPQSATAPSQEVMPVGAVSAATEPAPKPEEPQRTGNLWPDLQVLYWILSMFVAFEIFCLQRYALTPDNFVAVRNSELDAMATKAEHTHATSFGEQI